MLLASIFATVLFTNLSFFEDFEDFEDLGSGKKNSNSRVNSMPPAAKTLFVKRVLDSP
jgi:hypothetical protein